jgi:myo-inositol 2-dehydrogenase / D-chiro-inositol 1-dehydrogenase
MVSLAFAGAGWITPMHAMAAKALGIDVQAFASRTAEHAEAKAREFGGRALAYDQLPAGVDIVVVATPPSRHVADALHALTAGAAVMVEKPLATTLADADRLVAADIEGRVAYAENLAHCPAVHAMLERLGSIGPPSYIEVRTVGPRPTYGEFLTPEWGGGALFDLGAHPIALALLFGGSATVTAVTATMEAGSDHRSDEAATVTLSFDTGLRANIIVSWRAELPLWDAQASGPTGVVRAELLPTALVEHNGDTVALPRPKFSPTQLETLGYVSQLRSFADDLAANRRPVLDARFGRLVLDVICAAYASAGNGSTAVAVPFAGPRDRTPLQLWRGLSAG